MALPWVPYSRNDVRGLRPLAIVLLVLDCWFGSGSPTARRFVRRSVDPPSRGRLPAPDAALPEVPNLFLGASLPPRRRPSVGPTDPPTNRRYGSCGWREGCGPRARSQSHALGAPRRADSAAAAAAQGAAAPWVGGLARSRADGAEGADRRPTEAGLWPTPTQAGAVPTEAEEAQWSRRRGCSYSVWLWRATQRVRLLAFKTSMNPPEVRLYPNLQSRGFAARF